MNRLLTALGFLAVLAIVLSLALLARVQGTYVFTSTAAAATASQPPSDRPVFEMKYRGLSKPDDPLSYRSFWGFGGPEGANDPFVLAVKSRVKDSTVVYNGSLPNARWSVVELKDKRPVAFYFDLNADGRLSDKEKFLPAALSGSNFGYPHAFITSDFTIRAQDQREIPFRVMLVAMYNGPEDFSYMWSPACVLEGQATLAGEPMRLVLYTNGFGGSFTTFGSCSYALLEAQQGLEGYLPRYPLSSLIQHKGTFYRLRLDGTHEKGQIVRVTFEKDTTPTGQLAVALQGKESLQSRVGPAAITGATGNSIYFNLPDVKSPLPEGRYRLSSVTVDYGARKDNDWRATFSAGPVFEIRARQTRQIEVGGLTLAVQAMDEKDRNRSDAQERSTFAKGTPIYLTLQIKGKAGEVYTRFSQAGARANSFNDVKPHVAIVDSAGKEVAATDMEYG